MAPDTAAPHSAGTPRPAFDPLDGLVIKDDHLARILRGEDYLVQDGAMGTLLQAQGLAAHGELPDLLNLANPDAITAIHAGYVAAGAEMITTNTFGSNAHKLSGKATVAEVYRAAADCARAAGARYVAGGLGPVGELLEPLGTLSFDQAYDLFAEQVRAARDAGCDLILIETMTDLREMKAAVLAAKDHARLPIFASMTFGEDGRTFLGTPPDVAAIALSALGAHVLGVNCSLGPDELVPIAQTLVRFARCPVVVRPNAGLPHVEDGRTVYDVSPDAFAAAMERVLSFGVSVVGGCCGTTPAYIEKLAALVAGRTPVPRPASRACAVASAQRAIVLDEGAPGPVAIGERINPTGKPRLKEALRAGDFDYLVGEAVAQEEAGADVLDVNVGLPDLDEPEVLAAAVERLQATVTLPLQVDSSDPAALEAAVRRCVGKPLINSVSGKRASLEAVLPLAKKYGCAVVGLTLDEQGIPPTAEGRLAVAARIVEAAEAAGLPREDVVIDCLVMAAATNQDEVREVLRAVALVKERLGVRTVLGVSNVSFGLPRRALVTSTFLAAALGCGLDFAIVDPTSARIRDTLAAFRVVGGQDRGSAAFVAQYAETADPYAAPASGAALAAPASGTAAHPSASGATAHPFSGGATAHSVIPSGATEGSAAEGSRAASASYVPAPHAPTSAAPDLIPIPEPLADAADRVREIERYILSGRAAPMAAATEALLEGHDALAVIDGVLIPALDAVGRKFDRGEYFLPQLMASAEAVKAGFDVARTRFGAAPASDGRAILLATVEGDIHDIGKNIVKMLLENYGYTVVDLGRDVPSATIVEEAKRRNIRLVGLSALMTTTVKAMEETIALLHREAPGTSVFVGGAVLTPDYARTIGADYYGKDAAEAARIAEEFFAQ